MPKNSQFPGSNKLFMDELIDIIDEQDNVLYQVNKSKAHKLGLLHRTVIAEVRNSKGQILLVKQTSDRQDAGQYVSPVGGHVKAGESVEDALKREALEEIGLKDFQYKIVGKAIFNREVIGRKENHYFIVYEILTDEDLKLGDEAESYDFFSFQRIEDELKTKPEKFGGAYIFVYSNFYH